MRRFGAEGQLRASYGAVGEGPFEFRRITGIIDDEEGKVYLVDPRLSRITVLSADLQPDTLFSLPVPPLNEILRMGDSYLLATVPAPRTPGYSRMTDQWHPLWSVHPPGLHISDRPYWGSFASTRGAASPRYLATANSFSYPIRLHDPNGFLVDSLGSPPPSFRPAPVLDRGAFAHSDRDERMDEWMASFDEISALGFLVDTLLVVTHGELRRNRASGRTTQAHRRLDVYDLAQGRRIAQDVALPEGSRVLWIGRGRMHLLIDGPPAGWRVLKVEWAPGREAAFWDAGSDLVSHGGDRQPA